METQNLKTLKYEKEENKDCTAEKLKKEIIKRGEKNHKQKVSRFRR